MIAYIVKSSLCLMLLWVFYRLFLEKENIHFVKRFYLLFSLIFSFSIPLITLTYLVEVEPQPEVISENVIPVMTTSETIIAEDPVNYIPVILWCIYGIGVLVFGLRFSRNIMNISKKIRTNEQLKEQSHTNVLLQKSIVPHTFLSYIFVPKKEFKDKNIPEEVLLHEKTHVSQKHTLDILFVEILQVIFWFNPIFILIKKSVKLNHEFLADQNVLKQRFSIQNYFNLLLNYPNSPNQAVISSPINYSLTKKRLQMMTKEFSKKRTVLKLATLLPVFSLCLLLFNNEIVAKEVERSPNDMTNTHTEEKEALVSAVKLAEEESIFKDRKAGFQDGVTDEMVKKYNAWAKDLNFKIKNNKPITVKESEIYRMINIYKNMTSDQRKGAEEFPDIPPPPPAPEAPKELKSSKPPKPPKVKKGEKGDVPPPPPPPAPKEENGTFGQSKKTKKVKTDDGYAEILLAENEEWTEEEKAELKERVQNELARERAEMDRERAELQREKAMVMAEEARQQQELASELARLDAEEARQIAEEARALAVEATRSVNEENGKRQALENAKIGREAAEKARVMALEASHQTRNRSEKAMKKAEKQVRKAEKELQKAQMEARKAEIEARKKAMEAEMEARKEMRKAEMDARKAGIEARREELKTARMAENHTPEKLIERMAEKDADFYYNGKQISAKEALELVDKSNNNLSIDASTTNGKSKVILKD